MSEKREFWVEIDQEFPFRTITVEKVICFGFLEEGEELPRPSRKGCIVIKAVETSQQGE